MNNSWTDVKVSYSLNLAHLSAGNVDEAHFRLLIGLTSINSEKVILALRAFLVHGRTRREVCDEFGVNQGYFSLKLRQMQHTSQSIVALLPYYSQLLSSGVNQ